MNSVRHSFDVLVVGAGPAGMAAACCASESSLRVGIVDNNPQPGGQIWRGASQHSAIPEAADWYKRLAASRVEVLSSTEVYDQPAPGELAADSPKGACEIAYAKLILCTGARERFLPFPGWTLPNVIGAGGLQALVKSGFSIADKKIVVAGSGPLLLAVAAYLREHGGDVLLIAEQSPWRALIRFGLTVAFQKEKLAQSFQLRRQLSGVPYQAGCWPVAAKGNGQLESVTLRSGNKTWEERCDYLACGFFLVPNVELPMLLGCELRGGFVRVDEFQQTTVSEVLCAGEPAGIGGLELSLVEGQIAGYAAAGNCEAARKLFAERNRSRHFAAALHRAFGLRDELRSLPDDATFVCRCEDVTFARLRKHSSWRAAKLQTRCGMGPCQGRICGPAVELLLGWKVESVRPPIFPVAVSSLAKSVLMQSQSSMHEELR
ncbi:MAG: FAD/NAD(P)-binding oxidoreductase [Candidatus Acidiferrales bacterium]